LREVRVFCIRASIDASWSDEIERSGGRILEIFEKIYVLLERTDPL
jgi:hypothetical protein